jgi:glucosylceramidase
MKIHMLGKPAIWLILICTAMAQANLLSNGDFALGSDGTSDPDTQALDWNEWHSQWPADMNAWVNREANSNGLYGDPTNYHYALGYYGGYDAFIYQDAPATAGVTYKLSLDACLDPWWMNSFYYKLEFLNGSGAQISAFESPHHTQPGYDTGIPWANYDLIGTAPAGTQFIRALLRTYGEGGTARFDNISVTPENDPDYTDDFDVDFTDYLYLSEFWQRTTPQYDLNGDDFINIQDLEIFAQNWLIEQVPAGSTIAEINPTVTYQEIEGFGASLTDSSAWLLYEFLNASERQAVLTDLFDPDQGIGLSYLRQPMGASDFRLQEYSYDDVPSGQSDYDLSEFSIAYDENYIIPTLQEILAINPNVRIMGSPWSPPVWMKDSGQIGGGSLKTDVYPTYASYFVKYIQAYAVHGISIDAVTLQNEPYYEPWSYAGCRMEPADQIKLVKEMGPAFQNNAISTKILVWDHNWDNIDYSLDVLNDPQARNHIDGVAWHHYAGNVSAQTLVHNEYPTKGVYFTEGSDGTWNDGGFDADLIRNGLFMVETIQNWAKTVIKWNLALDQNNGPKIAGGCDTCYGVITINQSNRQVTPRPHYYALGHVSKFLRPGAVRIASGSASKHSVAFKNTDDSIVLYAVNPNAFASPLKIEWNGQRVMTSIPGRVIMTFRWDDVPNATVDVYLTTGDQTKLLSKEADLFFGN